MPQICSKTTVIIFKVLILAAVGHCVKTMAGIVSDVLVLKEFYTMNVYY